MAQGGGPNAKEIEGTLESVFEIVAK
jgi:hypothetical protein